MNNIIKFYNYVTKLYHKNINGENNIGFQYLIKRGISPFIIDKMMVGYVGNKNIIPRKIKKNGKIYNVPNNILDDSRLTNGNGNDYFLNSVIFPCMYKGNTIYFSSRRLDNAIPPHRHLRGHINTVYNIDAIETNKAIYITEGCIDALTLLSYGKPAIGLLGANRLNDKIASVFKGKTVVIAMDNDENGSGQKASYRNANILIRNGAEPYLLFLPNSGEKSVDINSFFMDNNIHNFNYIVKETSIPYRQTEHYLLNKNKKQYIPNNNIYNIENVIDYYNLDKKIITSKGYTVNCPIPKHVDDRASMHIYEETQSFYCFGCNKAGDAIDLIKFIEGISRSDAYNIYINI